MKEGPDRAIGRAGVSSGVVESALNILTPLWSLEKVGVRNRNSLRGRVSLRRRG